MRKAPDRLHSEIDRIVAGSHHDPHSVLGAHPAPDGVAIRALRPLAASVSAVLADGTRFDLPHIREGVFGATLPLTEIPSYRLAVRYPGPDGGPGEESLSDDPYRHLPTVGEFDLHLIGEGRHEELWRALGSHVRDYGDGPGEAAALREPFAPMHFGQVRGASFAVWAPNARGVRVVGDFNHWDGRGHPMRSLGGSGVWELFVPDVLEGARYKYEILSPDGQWRSKADPMARLAEHPPATASVVFTSGYQWDDAEWLKRRGHGERLREPISIYEVHLASWRPGLGYRELADELTAYVTGMGFTHVELLPVAEHPFGGSWGYQVTSYYAPTSRLGDPDDFRYLVDRLHQAGIGVILDWVPAHFPRDDWALARFDGTPLYEHSDPRRAEHPDWGTLIFDYGRAEVRNFLIANAVYWLEEFHADGLRVDAVASMLYLDYSRAEGEWTPNPLGGRENLDAVAFLHEVNSVCYRRAPGIMMIAEESTAWPGVTQPVHLGGLGFGLKWNMGWMHDTLAYLAHDPVFRHYHHNEITFSLMYAFSEHYVLPLSHDEVVHGKGSLLGKMPGDEWNRFAGLRALFGYMWAHPGKQLLFMGSEFGQGAEWSADRGPDWWVLDDEFHAGARRLVADLNQVYRSTPALWELDSSPEGFAWIDANDAGGNVLSFLRFGAAGEAPAEPARLQGPGATELAGPDRAAGPAAAAGSPPPVLACIVNFSGGPHSDYRVGLPWAGRWREAINTDAYEYGGSGVGNLGEVEAVAEPSHGQPASAVLTLPPLGVLWLVPAGS